MRATAMPDLLKGAEPAPSLADQIACVEREITMRKKVYPRQVARGNMGAVVMQLELARMAAVLETLKGLQRGSLDGR